LPICPLLGYGRAGYDEFVTLAINIGIGTSDTSVLSLLGPKMVGPQLMRIASGDEIPWLSDTAFSGPNF
jgi:hypothetical protein